MNPINVLKQEMKNSSRSMAIFLPLSIGIGLILLGSILLMLWKLAKDDSDEPENSGQEVGRNEIQANETIAYPSSSRYGEPPTYDQVFSISERTGPPSYQIAVALDTPPSYGYVNEAFDPPKYTA